MGLNILLSYKGTHKHLVNYPPYSSPFATSNGSLIVFPEWATICALLGLVVCLSCKEVNSLHYVLSGRNFIDIVFYLLPNAYDIFQGEWLDKENPLFPMHLENTREAHSFPFFSTPPIGQREARISTWNMTKSK